MARNLLRKENKKGVSIMVGYVILIVIAIGLSVAVFAYLKLYLPKDNPVCSNDVILSIDEVTCVDYDSDEEYDVNVTITNRGFFSVNGAFIRMGDVNRVFKEVLNEEPLTLFSIPNGVLEPGQVWESEPAVPMFYTPSPDESGQVKEIEIEPLVYVDGEPVLCGRAVVNKLVNCVQI
jgi:hypothetical protein